MNIKIDTMLICIVNTYLNKFEKKKNNISRKPTHLC